MEGEGPGYISRHEYSCTHANGHPDRILGSVKMVHLGPKLTGRMVAFLDRGKDVELG